MLPYGDHRGLSADLHRDSVLPVCRAAVVETCLFQEALQALATTAGIRLRGSLLLALGVLALGRRQPTGCQDDRDDQAGEHIHVHFSKHNARPFWLEPTRIAP